MYAAPSSAAPPRGPAGMESVLPGVEGGARGARNEAEDDNSVGRPRIGGRDAPPGRAGAGADTTVSYVARVAEASTPRARLGSGIGSSLTGEP